MAGPRHRAAPYRSGRALRTFCAVGSDLLAAAAPWPLVAVAIAIVVVLCLWGLFRRGSMSDRARRDGDHDPDRPVDGH